MNSHQFTVTVVSTNLAITYTDGEVITFPYAPLYFYAPTSRPRFLYFGPSNDDLTSVYWENCSNLNNTSRSNLRDAIYAILPPSLNIENYMDLTSIQLATNKTLLNPDFTGVATFAAIPTVSSVPVVTTTATQTLTNKTVSGYVDTTTAQTIAGIKQLSADLKLNSGTLTLGAVSASSGSTLLSGSVANNNTVSVQFPAESTRLIGRDSVDTLTNKTLTSPIISSISNTGTITIPTATGTLSTLDGTENLSNKTITSSTISGYVDLTSNQNIGGLKLFNGIVYLPSDVTLNNTVLHSTAVSPMTITLPNFNSTVATLAGSETLTSKTLTNPIISTISNSGTITLPTGTKTLATISGTETLTSKTLTSPIISTISNTGTLTLPTSTDTLVGKATSDVLTNKTLTSPIISSISNTGTITLPTATTTLVGTDTTDTLSNKTLTLPIISSFKSASGLNTITVPSGNRTLATLEGNETFTSTKTIATGNTLAFGNITSGVTNIICTNLTGTTTMILPQLSDTLVGRASIDNLTNKTITSSTISGYVDTTTTQTVGGAKTFSLGTTFSAGVYLSNPSSGSTLLVSGASTGNPSITFPAVGATLASLDGSEVLTNKTLTTPVITSISNSGTVTIPTGTNTLATIASVQTLTNKTLNSCLFTNSGWSTTALTANTTLTASQVLGGAMIQLGAFSGTLTFPSASSIIALITTPAANQSFVFYIQNASVNTWTLSMGTGIQSNTISSSVSPTSFRTLVFVLDTTSTLKVYG